MSTKPCEYCGHVLPLGVDKRTRQIRSAHFDSCTEKPVEELGPVQDDTAPATDVALLRQSLEALEAMKAEFRALDLPYGSKAYALGNEATHALKERLK